MDITFEVSDTHLYPGAEGVLKVDMSTLSKRPHPCSVIFSDNVAVLATIARTDDGLLRLEASAYRTGAGSDIAAKSWSLRIESSRGVTRGRIVRRMA